MPRLRSSKKSLRSARRRAEENKKIRGKLSKLIKGAKGKKDLPTLYKAVDKAAKRKIFARKKAARMKSKLSRKLAK